MKFAVDKIRAAENDNVMLTERGSMFGYQDLVIDYRGIPVMQQNKVPVILDITHSLQQPNQSSGVTGGRPELIGLVAKRALLWESMDCLLKRTRIRPMPNQMVRICCTWTGSKSCSFAYWLSAPPLPEKTPSYEGSFPRFPVAAQECNLRSACLPAFVCHGSQNEGKAAAIAANHDLFFAGTTNDNNLSQSNIYLLCTDSGEFPLATFVWRRRC